MDRDTQAKVLRAIRTFPGAVVLSTHDKILLTELSKDAGAPWNANRIPNNFVLEKRDGKTLITHSPESPVAYLERVMQAAKKQAGRVKA